MEKARKSQQTKGLVVLLITAMIVALCTPAEQSEAAKKPRLSKKTVVLTVGKSRKVKVKYVDKKTKITWKSKNKKIATVSKTGKITAKKKGKTYVTSRFRYRGKKYVLKCRVTVKKAASISTEEPDATETKTPNTVPSMASSTQPSAVPSMQPSAQPSVIPSTQPSVKPSEQPTAEPSEQPSAQPSAKPSAQPSVKPSEQPTAEPSEQPSAQPSVVPSAKPSAQPSEKPPIGPTVAPSSVPTAEPSVAPSTQPSTQPSSEPTKVPGTPIPAEEGKALSLDFEDGKNTYVTGRQGKETLTVTEGGYNDNYCLKVSNREKNWAGPQIDVTHNVTDYTTYTIEAYVKHQAGGDRMINCMWQAEDFAGNITYTTIQSLKVPTGNWKKIQATVVAPGDVKQLHMYFEMQNYQSEFYVDNISITEKHLDLDKVLAIESLSEAYSKQFPMGCEVYSYNLKNDEILQFIKHHYTRVTFGDELKPESLLNQEKSKASADGMPVINTDIIDKCLSLAQANNLQVRFHTLVWYSQTPDWYFCEGYEAQYDGNGTAKTNITNLVDEETMLQRMQSYITQIIQYTETKYPGVVYAYDVVNEVINDNGCKLRTGTKSLYGAIFGEEDNTYITKAFEYARAAQTAAGSGAKLFYNDYVGMASPGQMKAVVKYLADAKAAGTIDGLGMQAHQTNLNVSDGDNIKNALNLFKQNGYEVQITELDFASKDNSESGQETLANAYSKFMNIVLTQKNSNNVNVSGVTFWNLTDLDTWLNTQKDDGPYYPSLFDENYMPKAAFTALINLVKGTTPTATPTAAPTTAPTAVPTVTPTTVPTTAPTTVPTTAPTTVPTTAPTTVPTTAPTTEPTTAPTTEPTTAPTALPTEVPKPETSQILDVTQGNILIEEDGYTIGDGEKQNYTGAYTISGNSTESANTITVSSGTHTIVLDNVILTTTAESPISLADGAKVNLWLSGTTKLSAPAKKAGIEVPAGCELSISGEGSLQALSGESAAAIGASGSDKEAEAGSLGTIVIYSGTILAKSGRNGAGIGDGRCGQGGGEIIIYGGDIYAQSAGNGAGIGGGGSAAKTPATLTVKIYGGNISATGSAYAIGDGRRQTHCEVAIYGGAIYATPANKPVGTTWLTQDTYAAESIVVKNYSGIQKVTIDGVDQHISNFVIKDINGTPYTTCNFNLYMTKTENHTIVITDTEGVEHLIEVTR